MSTDFEFLSALVRDRSGIVIGKDKTYLLENRLGPIANRHKCAGIVELVARLRGNTNGALANEVVEAMTTNETLFFRDSRPFDALRNDLLPAILSNRAGARAIRIWSAACSTGQEPYSIAMVLKEQAMKLAGWHTSIYATDIASSVLAKARVGVYSQFEVQRGLPIQMLVKYFRQVGTHWEIDSALRVMVDFRENNIVTDHPPARQFDIIFCRNLLIYFDADLKRKVLSKLADVLAPDGALFLGGAESVLGLTDRLEPLPNMRGAYRHVKGAAASARRAAGAA